MRLKCFTSFFGNKTAECKKNWNAILFKSCADIHPRLVSYWSTDLTTCEEWEVIKTDVLDSPRGKQKQNNAVHTNLKQLVFGFTFRRAFTENGQRINPPPPPLHRHTQIYFSLCSHPSANNALKVLYLNRVVELNPGFIWDFILRHWQQQFKTAPVVKTRRCFMTLIKQCKTEQPTTVWRVCRVWSNLQASMAAPLQGSVLNNSILIFTNIPVDMDLCACQLISINFLVQQGSPEAYYCWH